MKNRDKLRNKALADLMLTICESRHKICPIQIVGEWKPKCENATTEDCKRCVMDWLNREVKQ